MNFFTLLIGILSIALSIITIIIIFILRKNVIDILNKDAIIFSKNFEIKKAAFDKAMYIIDEIGAGAPRSKTVEYSRKMNVALRQEISLGEAMILSDIDGEVKEYKIEIIKKYLNNNYDNKSMLIRVTDENLLNATGGIIQGMSGSPIIQNGKFCGAVTHVFVNNPTKGYAVFADKMIQELAEN